MSIETREIQPGDLANAAAVLLSAGCAGVGGLTWSIRLFMDGMRPHYPAGDSWHDDRILHGAVERALRLYMLTDGYEASDSDISYVGEA